MYTIFELIFEVLFGIGCVGMLLMRFMGVAHHSGGHWGGGHTMHGVGGHHGPLIGHGGGHVGHAASSVGRASGSALTRGAHPGPTNPSTIARSSDGSANADRAILLQFIPSPLDAVSFCLGAGALGMVFQATVAAPLIYAVAAAGGLALDLLVIRPIFRFAMKFVSKESEGLEGMVAATGEALTRFDERGMGMVRVIMEGQIVQLLATLEPSELAAGVTVKKGDSLVLLNVDSKKNTCCVTRELSLD